MKKAKAKMTQTLLGIIIAIAAAGTFFLYLGPEPGYEAMFRILMIITMLSIMIVACRALITLKSTVSSPSESRLTANSSRQFQNIIVREVCQ